MTQTERKLEELEIRVQACEVQLGLNVGSAEPDNMKGPGPTGSIETKDVAGGSEPPEPTGETLV